MENFSVMRINQKIVSVSINNETKVDLKETIRVTDVPLIDDAPARMITLKADERKWYLTVVYLPNTELPFALFCHTNNKEKSTQTSDAVERLAKLARNKGILNKHVDKMLIKTANESNVSKLTRTISLLLRHGVLIKNIIAELDKMEDVFIGSFLFQIKKFLAQYIKNGEVAEDTACEKCGGVLVFSEGCMICRECGYSKCG